MRDPTRETIRDHEQRAALDLLAAMETKTQLVGLVADQVRLEFTAHVEAVADEATQALDKLRGQLARLDDVAAVFGAGGRINLQHLDGHVARSRAVVDRWMVAATTAPQAPEIAARALFRVNQVRTPAKRGKDSVKDCVVIETYLDIVSALRTAGLTSKAVFVSSNTKDYETGRSLNSDLAAEFAGIGMEYAPNAAAAKYSLGL